MDDLIEFLTARLAEDEEALQGRTAIATGDLWALAGAGATMVLMHVGRARKEIAYKRQALEDYEQASGEAIRLNDPEAALWTLGLRKRLVQIAEIYSAHPDHKAAWRL
jgi:hypothetical protein